MTAERTVFIARHANREDFENPQWVEYAEYPHDPDLSARGIEEAKQLANRIAGADPASLCRLDLQGGSWNLRFQNDTSHLRINGTPVAARPSGPGS